MIERGRLRAGETVLVSGASGGAGIALIQIARARGARVLAINSASKTDAVHMPTHFALCRATSASVRTGRFIE